MKTINIANVVNSALGDANTADDLYVVLIGKCHTIVLQLISKQYLENILFLDLQKNQSLKDLFL